MRNFQTNKTMLTSGKNFVSENSSSEDNFILKLLEPQTKISRLLEYLIILTILKKHKKMKKNPSEGDLIKANLKVMEKLSFPEGIPLSKSVFFHLRRKPDPL